MTSTCFFAFPALMKLWFYKFYSAYQKVLKVPNAFPYNWYSLRLSLSNIQGHILYCVIQETHLLPSNFSVLKFSIKMWITLISLTVSILEFTVVSQRLLSIPLIFLLWKGSLTSKSLTTFFSVWSSKISFCMYSNTLLERCI